MDTLSTQFTAHGRDLYCNDRQYVRAWAGATVEFMQDSYLDVDQRAAFFQYAYSSVPAMVMRTIGAGSKYPVSPPQACAHTSHQARVGDDPFKVAHDQIPTARGRDRRECKRPRLVL